MFNDFNDFKDSPAVDEYELLRLRYEENEPRAEGKLPTLKVIYWVTGRPAFKEWLCPQHTGFARAKFETWWSDKTDCPLPSDVKTAKRYAENGALSIPKKIKVTKKPGEKFPRIDWVDFARITDFDPAACLTQDDWDVRKNCQEGFSEFAQFSMESTDDPLNFRRCGECYYFSPAVYCGGYCDKVAERTNFYDRECQFFKEDTKQTNIPEF